MIHLFREDPIAELLEPSRNGGAASELTEFVLALQDLGTVRPHRETAAEQMAAMRATTIVAPALAVAPQRAPRIRRAALAGFALPLAASGMAIAAVAGVDLPDPADDAFDAVGIELPNQSGNGDADRPQSDRPETPPASIPAGRPAAPGDDARGRALGREKSTGKPKDFAENPGNADPKGGKGNDNLPPRQSGTDPGPGAGAPGHSGVGPPGDPPAASNGANGTGPDVTPPGQGGSPSGQTFTPPEPTPPPHSSTGGNPAPSAGQGGAAPGQTGTTPSKGGTPPGQLKR